MAMTEKTKVLDKFLSVVKKKIKNDEDWKEIPAQVFEQDALYELAQITKVIFWEWGVK